MNKEVCWGVGGGQGAVGRDMGGLGGDVGKCVGGGKERCVGSGEVWGGCRKVYGVSGEVCWRVERVMGKM